MTTYHTPAITRALDHHQRAGTIRHWSYNAPGTHNPNRPWRIVFAPLGDSLNLTTREAHLVAVTLAHAERAARHTQETTR